MSYLLSFGFLFTMKLSRKSLNFIIFLLNLVLIFTANAESQTLLTKRPHNNRISAVLVFGDSTSDPGNNNYIPTPFKGNFPPYGRDFANQIPTGRFTDGLLTSDLVARYVGLKDNIPPYLDPTLTIQDLMTGVSFASAGSGYDPLTPTISNVISLPKQLEYFKAYQARLAAAIGRPRMKAVISNALYLVSAGTNDFVVNYFTLPIRRKNYTLPAYMDFLLKIQTQFLQKFDWKDERYKTRFRNLKSTNSQQSPTKTISLRKSKKDDEDLWDQGARRIGVAGLPPIGCLPIVITLFSDNANAVLHRGCIDFYSSVGRNYNLMLLGQLNHMQFNLAPNGARIAYFDTYGPLSDVIIGRKYGFEEVLVGCCGTGLLETTFLCNPKTYVCPNASKYVFFDSIHPTEKMYRIVFQSIQSAVDYLIKN